VRLIMFALMASARGGGHGAAEVVDFTAAAASMAVAKKM
jgi:hypothetical protein